MKNKLLFALLSLAFFNTILAQADKSYYYFTWGYNGSVYAKSDIHFSGEGYNFTLKNVVAKHRPTPLNGKSLFGTYLNPKFLTIPQFNCHIGRRISSKWGVTVGWDHMKYVVEQNQVVEINGTTLQTLSSPGGATVQIERGYTNEKITLSPDFLTFEHTDGYNIVSIDAEHFMNIYRADNQRFNVIGTLGVGLAMVVPRSDVRLFGVGANHPWNISGEGILAKSSVQCHFNKRFFLEAVLKSGYTYLHAIPTTGIKGDKATQGIGFLEGVLQLGIKI
jgi:hypothetical protein